MRPSHAHSCDTRSCSSLALALGRKTSFGLQSCSQRNSKRSTEPAGAITRAPAYFLRQTSNRLLRKELLQQGSQALTKVVWLPSGLHLREIQPALLGEAANSTVPAITGCWKQNREGPGYQRTPCYWSIILLACCDIKPSAQRIPASVPTFSMQVVTSCVLPMHTGI